jgi:hypothetical protein
MEAFLLIVFATSSLTTLVFLSSLYLSILNKIQEKKQIEYWSHINESMKKINELNRIEFIGGPFDGDWKFLPKDKSIYVYKNHQYIIEEINDGNKTKKVYKYSKK